MISGFTDAPMQRNSESCGLSLIMVGMYCKSEKFCWQTIFCISQNLYTERKFIISVTPNHENIPINDGFVCDHDVYNNYIRICIIFFLAKNIMF